ncbi:AAA family ATPase [Salinicoccus sp. CNSTN-B1]
MESIRPSIPSYYTTTPMKFKKVGKQTSSGGATIFLTQTRANYSTYENYFNDFSDDNTYKVDIEGLKKYMFTVKFEYILNIIPPDGLEYSGEVTLDYWKKKLDELKQCDENRLNINVEKHMASNGRFYIRTQNIPDQEPIVTLIRSIVVPGVSQMEITREETDEENKFIYFFRPVLTEDLNSHLNYYSTREDVFDSEEFPSEPGKNLIIYGAPGTGKSNEANKIYFNKNSTRVTFHPEYTYHDFVGSFRPEPLYKKVSNPNYSLLTVDGEEFQKGEPLINYQFVPGPFTLILERALKAKKENSSEMFNLIIEEMNRANAPAVFGDLFQLLDRDSFGESIYSVSNLEVLKYLRNSDVLNQDDKEFKLPSNLNLIGTMNSADQGVFVMDSAFKRRWIFKYMPINLNEAIHKNELVPYNNQFVRWHQFVSKINNMLATLGIREDRHIGPYFLKPGEPQKAEMISDKLLMYLWDDIFKMQKSSFFADEITTLSQLINDYNCGKPVFKIDFEFLEEEEHEELSNERDYENE